MRIAIDGTLVEPGHAHVSVLDHGLLYGDGIFEGMRVYHGRLFRLEDHLARLAIGASALGLTLPGGLDAVRRTVLATCAAHGKPDAYVRLVVTRGEGPLGVDPTDCGPGRTICIVGDIALHSDATRARGVAVITSSHRRPPPDVLDPRIKSLNYLNNVQAKREARMRGADEALLLNARGLVAEAAVANVFAVRGGRLVTPPATEGALEGITRRTVLELSRELGIAAAEQPMGRLDLLGADEAFLTGSGAGIVPIASLDGVQIGTGDRPVTRAILQAFDACTRRGTTGDGPIAYDAVS
ncbi:MAG: aminotransferase class IV [Myxococcota bacterium]